MSFKSWKEYREEDEPKEAKVKLGQSGPDCRYEKFEVNIVHKNQPNKADSTLTKINEATKEDFLEIKGIGPKTADKILQQQPCQNLDELKLMASVKKKLIKWASM